jgi:hypothetical protein
MECIGSGACRTRRRARCTRPAASALVRSGTDASRSTGIIDASGGDDCFARLQSSTLGAGCFEIGVRSETASDGQVTDRAEHEQHDGEPQASHDRDDQDGHGCLHLSAPPLTCRKRGGCQGHRLDARTRQQPGGAADREFVQGLLGQQRRRKRIQLTAVHRQQATRLSRRLFEQPPHLGVDRLGRRLTVWLARAEPEALRG